MSRGDEKRKSYTVNGIAAARAQFERIGLPFPFVPPELVDDVVQVSEWVFGTRAGGPTPYNLGWYLTEVVTQPVADYVLFGQDGHGITSYAAHYYLKRGPLALLTQYEWKGAYSAPDATSLIVERYGEIVALAAAMEDAVAAGKVAEDELLIVVDSDFGQASWRLLRGYDEGREALLEARWHNSQNPLAAALDAVRSRLA